MQPISLHYKNSALISDEEIAQISAELHEYIEYMKNVVAQRSYDVPEASLHLVSDEQQVSRAQEMVDSVDCSKVKYFLHIGIGGSSLGAKAIYEALRGITDPLKSGTLKIIFLDTINPEVLSDVEKLLAQKVASPEEIVVHIVSKSGTTTETIANAEIIHRMLCERWSAEEISSRFVVSTDQGSKLWQEAERLGFATLAMPQNVGGRFSVFTSAHFFPLLCAGIDVSSLREGAHMMQEQCLTLSPEENPALASAVLLYAHNNKGATIHNNFFFNGELESVGKWYRQLMGESIGKMKDVSGNVVHAGITPIVSIGSTALHSMAQLYLGGPKDKLTTFIYARPKDFIHVPKDMLFVSLDAGFSGRSTSEIMDAILGGTKEAYRKNNLPFMEVEFPDMSAGSIGQYLAFKMIEIMFLAKLLHIDAFNQPRVEDYKKETRNILEA